MLNDLIRKARIGISSLESEGTESDPYKISSVDELQTIQHSSPNMSHFELVDLRRFIIVGTGSITAPYQ